MKRGGVNIISHIKYELGQKRVDNTLSEAQLKP